MTEVVVFSFLGGIGNGIEGCSMLTAIQRLVPDEGQAQLNTIVEALHDAMPGLGFLIGGLLASAASAQATYLVAALGALGVLLAVARPLCLPGRQQARTLPAALPQH